MNTLQNSIAIIKSEKEFEKKVISNVAPSIILFKTTWSGDAFLMSGIFNKIQEESAEKLQLFSIDIEVLPALKERFHIDQIPTVLFIREGKVVGKIKKILPSNVVKLKVNSFINFIAKGA